MKDKKMIVISVDSMVTEDLEIIKQLPNMGYVLKNASIIKRNESTYPTFTHSVHTSIITGCYPGTHGVISNEYFMPGVDNPVWFEHRSDVKVPMLPDTAKKYGYDTAYIYWPLTLGADAKWVIHRAGHNVTKSLQETIRERSTPGFFDELYPYVKESFNLDEYHREDQLCFDTAEYMIHTYQPDIIYIHLILIDYMRHQHGVFSEHLQSAYEFLDAGVGKILAALRQMNLEDKTIINFTSDHGHIDIKKVISINRFFKDNGLIQTDENGKFIDWQAYFHSCSLSGHVYIKNHDPIIQEKVLKLLTDHQEDLEIEKIYTKKEVADKYRLTGDFDFVIESKGSASYSSKYNVPLVCSTDNKDYKSSVATHGYEPSKGVQPTFFIKNPYSTKRVILESNKIVNQAPTLARLLGFDLTTSDGEPIRELLE